MHAGRAGRKRATRKPREPKSAPVVEAMEHEDCQFHFPRSGRNGHRMQNFIFTLHGDDHQLRVAMQQLKDLFTNNCEYIIVGVEVGETTGKQHLQGAVCLGQQKPWSTIKNMIPFRRAFLAPMHGNAMQNQVYCSKDHNYWEFGKPPATAVGKVNLKDFVEKVCSGYSMREIAHESLDGAKAVAVHGRGLNFLRLQLNLGRSEPRLKRKVYWFYGPTGSGKTRAATEFGVLFPGSYWRSPNPRLEWFDGYTDQPVAIVDDFRPKKVSFNFLLQVLDIYPMYVPVKGGYVDWTPDFIIVTSPKPIEETFYERFKFIPEDINQLVRRVTESYNFALSEDKAKWLVTASDLRTEWVSPSRESIFGCDISNLVQSPAEEGGRKNGPNLGGVIRDRSDIAQVNADPPPGGASSVTSTIDGLSGGQAVSRRAIGDELGPARLVDFSTTRRACLEADKFLEELEHERLEFRELCRRFELEHSIPSSSSSTDMPDSPTSINLRLRRSDPFEFEQ